ncbi:MAG: hypothetical protein JXR94_17565, partial [Candidatus Hydrogenedentes bacterium]|nr:hypothetical protein [Candidatus Hydrogenedentota bacterium]
MSRHGEQNERPDDASVDALVRNALAGEAPADVLEQAEGRFEQIRQGVGRGGGVRRGVRALAWGAALGAAAFVLAAGAILWTPGNLTWAEVAQRFGRVEFFSGTVFITENAAEPPEKVEVWAARDGRLRAHQRGRVFFGRDGAVTAAWDVGSRQRFDVGELDRRQLDEYHVAEAVQLVELLGKMDGLSLDSLLAHVCGRTTISPPLRNGAASVSGDMQVFDVTNDRTPEWLRVWVLKDSGLPVRLRLWDPRDGDSTEMLFEYMEEQPDEAFDPQAFAEVLAPRDTTTNKAYALLRDPGGRN